MPSFEMGIALIILAVAVIGAGFFSSDNITGGTVGNLVTGNVIGITGMDVADSHWATVTQQGFYDFNGNKLDSRPISQDYVDVSVTLDSGEVNAQKISASGSPSLLYSGPINARTNRLTQQGMSQLGIPASFQDHVLGLAGQAYNSKGGTNSFGNRYYTNEGGSIYTYDGQDKKVFLFSTNIGSTNNPSTITFDDWQDTYVRFHIPDFYNDGNPDSGLALVRINPDNSQQVQFQNNGVWQTSTIYSAQDGAVVRSGTTDEVVTMPLDAQIEGTLVDATGLSPSILGTKAYYKEIVGPDGATVLMGWDEGQWEPIEAWGSIAELRTRDRWEYRPMTQATTTPSAANVVYNPLGNTPFERRDDGNGDGHFGASRAGGTRTHSSLDIPAPAGTSVRPASDGIVYEVGEDRDGYGHYVIVKHTGVDGGIYYTRYSHLQESPTSLGIRVNQQVSAGSDGTVIGNVGTSGNAANTQPHLDFQLIQDREGNWFALDPAANMDVLGDSTALNNRGFNTFFRTRSTTIPSGGFSISTRQGGIVTSVSGTQTFTFAVRDAYTGLVTYKDISADNVNKARDKLRQELLREGWRSNEYSLDYVQPGSGVAGQTDIYMIRVDGRITEYRVPTNNIQRDRVLDLIRERLQADGSVLTSVDGTGSSFTKKRPEVYQSYRPEGSKVTLTLADGSNLVLQQDPTNPNLYSGMLNGKTWSFNINDRTFVAASAAVIPIDSGDIVSFEGYDRNGNMLVKVKRGDVESTVVAPQQADGTFNIGGEPYIHIPGAAKPQSAILSSGARFTNEFALVEGGLLFYNSETKKFYTANNQLVADGKDIVRSETMLEDGSSLGQYFTVGSGGQINEHSPSGYLLGKDGESLKISQEVYNILTDGGRITMRGISSITDGSRAEVITQQGVKLKITKTGDRTTIEYPSDKDGVSTTVEYDESAGTTKTTREAYRNGQLSKTEVLVSREGHQLVMNHGGSDFLGGSFSADGMNIQLANPETVRAAESFGGDIIDVLYLAAVAEGATNDAGWSFSDSDLKVRETTITRVIIHPDHVVTPILDGLITGNEMIYARKHKAGSTSGSIYITTPGGYTYYGGSNFIEPDGSKFTPTSAESVTREFTTTARIGSGNNIITMNPGDYVRETRDNGRPEGTFIYKNGRIAGGIIKDGTSVKTIRTENLYNANGQWSSQDYANDPFTKFMHEKYEEWSVESFGIRLQAASEIAQGGRGLSTLLGCGTADDFNFLGIKCGDWRRKVDTWFTETVLGSVISGRWEESFCHASVPRDKPEGGYVNFRRPGGLVGVGAHIEGERTTINYPDGTKEYLYKITYGIDNPQFVERERAFEFGYNVGLSNDGRTVNIYEQNQPVELGGKIEQVGEEAIVKYSDSFYDKVCLDFTEEILTARSCWDLASTDCNGVKQVCNRISSVEETRGATHYRRPGEEEQETTPEEALEEAVMNDW
ncbi:MAG: M23 family metallopeptidase [Nanoarchaeota archaeon]|nr:M23 family metallopeptidase [Nanoarchaeota archaeon]